MRVLFSFALVAALLVSSTQAADGNAAASKTGEAKAAGAAVDATAEEFLRFANYARSLYGAGPLTADPHLMSLARSHSNWMASTGRFQHSSFGVAENIGMGQRTPWEIYNSWWNSSGHRQNMLGRHYTRVGVAYANGYWTAVFQ